MDRWNDKWIVTEWISHPYSLNLVYTVDIGSKVVNSSFLHIPEMSSKVSVHSWIRRGVLYSLDYYFIIMGVESYITIIKVNYVLFVSKFPYLVMTICVVLNSYMNHIH